MFGRANGPSELHLLHLCGFRGPIGCADFDPEPGFMAGDELQATADTIPLEDCSRQVQPLQGVELVIANHLGLV